MLHKRHWRASAVAAAVLAVLSTAVTTSAQPIAHALPGVPQLAQADAADHPVAVRAASPSALSERFCAEGAAWVRPRFAPLTLRGGDTVTVRSDDGTAFTLTSDHGTGKAVSTRSFPGSCVTVIANLASPGSQFTVDSLQAGAGAADVVVAGAGDICGSNCTETADLIQAIGPEAVFTTGDNAYDRGTLTEFRTRYDPAWGPFKSITKPTPGNHEYGTSGASGYFDYFNGVGNATGPVGERGKGYYSWDVGDWHFVALNSNVSMSAGSTQETWLRNDLRSSTKPCTAAYWHHPLFTRGSHSNSTSTRPLWQALYDNKADLVLAGHDHNYQRYAPQRPDGTLDRTNGIRQILVGTGGKALYNFSRTMPNVEASDDRTYGVLKLALSPTGYTGDFVPVDGRTYTDRFTGSCKAKGSGFTLAADPAAVTVAPGGSATTRVTVTGTGGFGSATTLSVSGLPGGVTAAVSPNPVTPPANGSASATLTLSAAATASPGTTPVTVTGTAGSLSRTATVSLTVGSGGGTVFADDFETDKGWIFDPYGDDTASTGLFERGDPAATSENGQAKQLGTTTSGTRCLVTGRLAGSGTGSHDVDTGSTSALSPAITLPAGPLRLSLRWSVGFGANATSSDYLTVTVIGDSDIVVLDRPGTGSHIGGAWQTATADLSELAGQTVRVLVEAADDGSASLIEAQVDDLTISRA